MAAGRLEAWKGSSEFVKGWYTGLDLAQLTTFPLEAQEELVAVEDDLVKRAAAIAEYTNTSIFVPERVENGVEAPPEWFGLNPEDGEDSAEVIDSSSEEGDEEEEEGEEEAPDVGADGRCGERARGLAATSASGEGKGGSEARAHWGRRGNGSGGRGGCRGRRGGEGQAGKGGPGGVG